MLKIRKKSTLAEIAENTSQIGAFSEILIRINQLKYLEKSFKMMLQLLNELYQMYEGGLINEPMFIKLSNFCLEMM